MVNIVLNSEELKKKILKDKFNSLIFKMSKGQEVYIVGGYIRDILRGIETRDRDYVISMDIIPFIHTINKHIGGTIVDFGEGDTIRIVLSDGTTMDFSKISGSINEDLSKRDFTINSFAWAPKTGLIDNYNGLNDMRMRLIRAIKKENLIKDPLRILRAYRFAGLMNGDIEKDTRRFLKQLSNKIEIISSERITLELFHLLNLEYSGRYLKMVLSDGILDRILSIPSRILYQNIRVISEVETSLKKGIHNNLKVLLNKTFSQNLTYKGLLSLEILMKDKKINHNYNLIKISNKIRKKIELFQKGIKIYENKKVELRKKLYDIFINSKDASIDLLIIKGRLDLLKEYRRFKNIMKKSLLSSEEIMNLTNLNEGKHLGKVIKELKRMEFEGTIKSRNMAITYIKNIKDKILHNISYQT